MAYDWDSSWTDIKMRLLVDGSQVDPALKEYARKIKTFEDDIGRDNGVGGVWNPNPVNAFGKAVAAAGEKINSFGKITVGRFDQIMLAAAGFATIRPFASWIVDGLKFVAVQEQIRAGITAQLVSNATIYDGYGKVATGLDAISNASIIAAKSQKDLRQYLYSSLATLEDLTKAYQVSVGPAMRASFDDKQVVAFTGRVAQMASAIDPLLLKSGQLAQEIRGIFQGDISRHSRLSQLLFSDVPAGQVKKLVRELQESGKFFDYVMEKMAPYAEAGTKITATWTGELQKLKSAWQEGVGESMTPLADQFAESLRAISEEFIVINEETGKKELNQDVKNMFRDWAMGASLVAEQLGLIGTTIPTVASRWRSMWDTVGDNHPLLAPISALYNLLGYDDGRQQKEKDLAKLQDSNLEKTNAVNRGKMKANQLGFLDDWNTFQTKIYNDSGMPFEMAEQIMVRLGKLAKTSSVDFVTAFRQIEESLTKTKQPIKDFNAILAEYEKSKITDPSAKGKGKEDPDSNDKEIKKAADAREKARESIAKYIANLERENEKIAANTEAFKASNEFEKINADYKKDLADATDAAADKLSGLSDEFKILGLTSPEANNALAITNKYIKNLESEAAAKSIQKTTEALNKLLGNPYEVFLKAQTQLLESNMERTSQRGKELLDKLKTEWLNEQKPFAAEFGRQSVLGLGDALMGFANGQGQKFGEVMAKSFTSFVQMGADEVAETFMLYAAKMFGQNIAYDSKTKKWTVDGKGEFDSLGEAAGATTGGKVLMGAQVVAGAGMTGYSAGQAGEGGRTAGAMSGAMAGMATGNPVMVAIGAIAGFLGGVLGEQQRQSEYKYGIPTIGEDGSIGLAGSKNIGKGELTQINTRLQETLDTFWNGFVDIVLKFPDHQLIPELEKIDGKFQENPSGKYLKHLDEFINGTLPDQIAEIFKNGLKFDFATVGLSAEEFEGLWAKLNKLDPAKMVAALGALANGLIKIQKVTDEMRGDTSRTDPSGAPISRFNQYVDQNWAKPQLSVTLSQVGQDILAFQENISSYSGEAQLRKIEELSNMADNFWQQMKDGMNALMQLSNEVLKSADAYLRDLTMRGFQKEDGTPDYEKQAEFLQEYLDKILGQMATASSPEELSALWNEYLSGVKQMEGIYAQMGPEAAEAIRGWAIDSVQLGRDYMLQQIQRLGDAIGEQSELFLAKFEPAMEKLKESFVAIGEAGGDLGGDIGDIVDIDLPLFKNAIVDAADAVSAFAGRLNNAQLSINVNIDGTEEDYAAVVVGNR